jgi:beta-galactosidase
MKKIYTVDKPHKLMLQADRTTITAYGEDLAFVTVTVVDKNGVPCDSN